jgi:hypothetical protein
MMLRQVKRRKNLHHLLGFLGDLLHRLVILKLLLQLLLILMKDAQEDLNKKNF